jgi:hypothetical protein
MKHSLRLRGDVLDRLLAPLGHVTDDSKARFLGVSPSSLSRLRREQIDPSSQFIAAVRIALPGAPFEDLFEIVRVGEEAA